MGKQTGRPGAATGTGVPVLKSPTSPSATGRARRRRREPRREGRHHLRLRRPQRSRQDHAHPLHRGRVHHDLGRHPRLRYVGARAAGGVQAPDGLRARQPRRLRLSHGSAVPRPHRRRLRGAPGAAPAAHRALRADLPHRGAPGRARLLVLARHATEARARQRLSARTSAARARRAVRRPRPAGVHELKALMREFTQSGGAIFFSSHVLEVVERLCDEIAIIREGRIVRCAPPRRSAATTASRTCSWSLLTTARPTGHGAAERGRDMRGFASLLCVQARGAFA